MGGIIRLISCMAHLPVSILVMLFVFIHGNSEKKRKELSEKDESQEDLSF